MTTSSSDADVVSLVAELDGADDAEHPDVSVTHESGWALSAFSDGLVVWENVECDGPALHRAPVDRVEVRRLFSLLVSDDVAAVTAFGWEPGYGT